MLTEIGHELAEVLKRAIDDHVITNAEYEEIYNLALASGGSLAADELEHLETALLRLLAGAARKPG